MRENEIEKTTLHIGPLMIQWYAFKRPKCAWLSYCVCIIKGREKNVDRMYNTFQHILSSLSAFISYSKFTTRRFLLYFTTLTHSLSRHLLIRARSHSPFHFFSATSISMVKCCKNFFANVHIHKATAYVIQLHFLKG